MLIKVLVAVAIALIVFVVIVALRPSEFRVTRRTTIDAPASAIFAEVNDFHRWVAWSPFEKLDPEARKTFEGSTSGEGAVYRWSGNSQAGEGSTTITESRPNELIRMKLEMIRPFACTNDVEFTFTPTENGTTMAWTMSGTNNFVAKAVGLFMNCDKMIGGPFEEGLEKLKSVAESPEPVARS